MNSERKEDSGRKVSSATADTIGQRDDRPPIEMEEETTEPMEMVMASEMSMDSGSATPWENFSLKNRIVKTQHPPAVKPSQATEGRQPTLEEEGNETATQSGNDKVASIPRSTMFESNQTENKASPTAEKE